MPIELDTKSATNGDAKIKVIGVGGGGGNAINNMILRELKGVDFIVANTDSQALLHNKSQMKIQLGTGLGAGAVPEVAKKAIESATDQVKDALKGSDMIFVTAGMGGGTGTGAAPIIAKIGQELGALVVGIVTKPFDWEGNKRMKIANDGISELRQYVDALIVIPNQRILEVTEKNTSFQAAFQKVDEILYNATRGISDIINDYGMVNVDFADVKTIMKDMGDALMGIGVSSGEKRAINATNEALNSPLLDNISIKGSQGVLINISGGYDMSMHEVSEAVSIVQAAAGEDVNLIHGVVINPELEGSVSVTVVATGFNKGKKSESPKDEQPEELFESPKSSDNGVKKGPIRITLPEPVSGTKGPITPGVRNIGGYHPNSDDKNKIIISSPKGGKVLTKFDEPAVNRRDTIISSSANNFLAIDSNTKEVVDKFSTTSLPSKPSVSEHISSTFLRKMTDI